MTGIFSKASVNAKSIKKFAAFIFTVFLVM